jgi:hypothetical protein
MMQMTTPVALRSLRENAFALDALRKGAIAQMGLGGTTVKQLRGEYDRDPDEHELYLMTVGLALAELLTCCDQLDNAPHLMTNYRETQAMRGRGINRHSHVVFHIEGYLIRTQSILDRCLRLIDAVFHLTNDPKSCREQVVLRNSKVRRTNVPHLLKSIQKVLARYASTRNVLVHQGSLWDEELRRIEMFYIVEEAERAEGKTQWEYAGARRILTQSFLRAKKKEYLSFNSDLSKVIAPLFDGLYPHYRTIESALLKQLGKARSNGLRPSPRG